MSKNKKVTKKVLKQKDTEQDSNEPEDPQQRPDIGQKKVASSRTPPKDMRRQQQRVVTRSLSEASLKQPSRKVILTWHPVTQKKELQILHRATSTLTQKSPQKLSKRTKLLIKQFKENSFEVDQVKGKKIVEKRTIYKVKYSGYSKPEWQESFNLYGCFECVFDYESKQAKPSNKAIRARVAGDQEARRGLLNLGSTCYLNAVIQVLNKSPEITLGCLEWLQDNQNPFLQDYVELNFHITELNGVPFRPLAFFDRFIQDFQGYSAGQHDSAEVMEAIIDKIATITNQAQQVDKTSEIQQEKGMNDQQLFHWTQTRENKRQQSFINSILTGWFKYVTTCATCNTASRKFQRFNLLHLPLPLPEGNALTLQRCLAQLSRPELLDDKEQVYCSTCKTKTKANRTIQLFKANKLLLICFKRFTKAGKLIVELDMPFELNQQVIPQLDGQRYQLHAIINHYGNKTTSGHYKAVCRINQTWIEFDDIVANPIPQQEVQSRLKTAYIVVYGSLLHH